MTACIFSVIILVLISLGQRGSSFFGVSFVREGFFCVERVVTAPFDYVSNLWTDYVFVVNARQENLELKKKQAAMEVRCMRMEDLRLENERLLSMAGFQDQYPQFTLHPSRVVAQDIALVSRTAVIDQGSRSGFFTDMPIVNPDGVVGRIIDVSPHTSQALLITDPNSAISALVLSNRVRGIVKGRGQGRLSLEYVRTGEDIHVGDMVVTSGLLGIFPRGLKIGRIEQIHRDRHNIFATIILRPCVHVRRIEEIFGVENKGVKKNANQMD
ncbi:MAG: rod shape-determining protein MreC [Thermodesulfobacteriota bacterium]|nr:rod shape-determining protein MreC [Thermodesulfobacteriota bacterium]